jgi:probable F420-dependent oxidoreductase
MLPTSGSTMDPSALGALAQAAEDLGFDSVWLDDHVVIPETVTTSYPYRADGSFATAPDQPFLEPIASLAYLAGVTRRVRLGISVLVLPYRHPLLTAKMIATIDVLSGGRTELGVGIGWMWEEFEALGHGRSVFDRRGTVSDEQLRILKTAWSDTVCAADGEFYQFHRVGTQPHPVQRPHPPVWIGGNSRAALRRTARYGDGWLPYSAAPPLDLPPEFIARGRAFIQQEASDNGRDPGSLRICFSTDVACLESPFEQRPAFTGSPEQIAGDFVRYRRAGVDRFIVSLGAVAPTDFERRLRWFAEVVRPAVASRIESPHQPCSRE